MPRPPKTKVDRLIERDGQLMKTCEKKQGCNRTLPVEEFAPRKGEGLRSSFLQSIAAYYASPSVQTRAAVVARICKECDRCRDSRKRSTVSSNSASGKCRAYWHELKRTKFHTCVDCGGKRSLEADNVISEHERAELFAQGKVLHAQHHPLSDYVWWARRKNGGIDGMKLEAEVCVPRCNMCHKLQSTSNAGKRVNFDTLPDPVAQEWKVDEIMFRKRSKAKWRWPRHCYIDSLKLQVGLCENRDCLRDGPGNGRCVAGFEVCYDWEHTNAAVKGACISEMCSNLSQTMPLEEWKRKVRDELERGDCRLLCRNCHHLKTWYGMEPKYDGCVPVECEVCE